MIRLINKFIFFKLLGWKITGKVPDDKKIVVYVEDISDQKKSSSKDDVEDYLSGQDEPAAQKIEIPDELTDKSSEEESGK